MHAAVVTEVGGVPQYTEFETPVAGDGELLVDVKAAAISNLTRMMVDHPDYSEGRRPPFVIGAEGAGVAADGRRVVFGCRRAPFGSFAEISVFPAILSFDIPDEMDDITAAALLNPTFSSWLPLASHTPIHSGETVLVLGATGVAGQLAVQIAKILGAGKVVAAGRNPETLAGLSDLGADVVVPLDNEDAASAAFADIIADGDLLVLDYLWGHSAEVLLNAIPRTFEVTKAVRWLQIGNSAGAHVSVEATTLRRAGITLIGSGAMPGLDEVKEIWRQMATHSVAGHLTVATETAPITEISSAWHTELAGKRLVVTI